MVVLGTTIREFAFHSPSLRAQASSQTMLRAENAWILAPGAPRGANTQQIG
jgi:hypothetical protein